MKKFEYLRKYNATSGDLGTLGLEGWELVAVTIASGQHYNPDLVFYFKREIL